MTTSRVRIISFFIIGYMILALAWWTWLLYHKNDDVYAYQEILYEQGNTEYVDPDFRQKYQRQKFMIIGEGLVFGASLILGIWIINRAIADEVRVAKLKNNFLLAITHELKTPISSIKMVLHTIINKPGLDTQKKQQISKTAYRETNRLESMVNKLLLSTRIEDQYQYNFEEVHLKYFMSQIIYYFPKQEFDRHISLSCPPELTAEIDQETFKSVILNLIENAIKYSPAHTPIHLIVEQRGTEIAIMVKDEGIGIEADEKQKVIENFIGLATKNSDLFLVQGLGLFIVDSIVKAHGGRMLLSDNQPAGTIVTVVIPKLNASKNG